MKRVNLFANLFLLLILFAAVIASCRKKSNETSFTFAFMTDIHLAYERNAVPGFKKAIDELNTLKPDFVITGGDLIMDALGQRYSLADSLYKLYQETVKGLTVPLHNTMGNHEIYGIYSRSRADRSNPEFGEKMFESRLGKSYYSFDHKGWKFFIVNSIEDTGRDRYEGKIDSLQAEWIKSELAVTPKETPIVISTHIPFITATTQKYDGSTVANDSSTVVWNSMEILRLFREHNLKLVLQGHLHTVEEINIDGIKFITCGALSGGWWKGSNRGYEEGFMVLKVKDGEVSARYHDYGWTVAGDN